MATTGKPWTTEEDEALQTEIFSGTSRFAISQKLNRSESAVKARAYILRLSLRPFEMKHSLSKQDLGVRCITTPSKNGPTSG